MKFRRAGAAVVAAAGIGAFAVGLVAAFVIYLQQGGAPARAWAERAPGLYRLVLDKWRIDELYHAWVVEGLEWMADIALAIDRAVDFVLASLTAAIARVFGSGLRLLQTGRVQAYAAAMVIGAGVLGWFLLVPQAQARTVEDAAQGAYRVEASPGFGLRLPLGSGR